MDNLLPTPATLLPDDEAARAALADGVPPDQVAADHPRDSLPWAVLAESALADGRSVEGYAFARTGYHRGLDALRKAGWRGAGPVPWSHEPNRGFLRSLAALGRARRGDRGGRRACPLPHVPGRPRSGVAAPPDLTGSSGRMAT